MDGILKRRGAENAEEVLRKELCVLCDSAFLFLQALAELTQRSQRKGVKDNSVFLSSL